MNDCVLVDVCVIDGVVVLVFVTVRVGLKLNVCVGLLEKVVVG